MYILKDQKTKVFPLFVLVTTILQIGLLFLLLIQGIWIWRLERRPVPTLVQLLDGRAVQVAPMSHLDRTPETIRRFTNEVMTLTFSWSGSLPALTVDQARNPQPDPGIPIVGGGLNARVATSTWQAGFAFSEAFRKDFITRVAALTPSGVFANNGTQGMLVVRRIGEPERLEPGRWKVALVANLLIFDGQDKVGRAVPFNKEIFISAIDPPAMPLGEQTSGLEQIVYRIRQAGLEITAIRDLPRENL